MKLPLFIFFCFLIGHIKVGAQNIIDLPVLKQYLIKHKQCDTIRVLKLIDCAIACDGFNNDSGFNYAKQALADSYKINYRIGIIKSLDEMGAYYFARGNYPKALSLFFDVKTKSETENYQRGSGAASANIGNIYSTEHEYKVAIPYLLIAKNTFEKDSYKDNLIGVYNTLTVCYLTINIDSAIFYNNLAYQTAMSKNSITKFGEVYYYEAEIHEKIGDGLALSYFNLGLKSSFYIRDYSDLSTIYSGMSDYYNDHKNSDSSILYARKSIYYGKKSGFLVAMEDGINNLAKYYEHINSDSGIKYLIEDIKLRDSLFGGNTRKQIDDLSFLEEKHQGEIVEQSKLVNKRHKNFLAYLGISLLISIFLLFVLILKFIKARAGRKKRRYTVIKFLGIFVLLLSFEFINLIIHSFITEWTNDNPFYTFIILVAVSSILIPVHHHLEEWLRKKFARQTPTKKINALP